MTRTRSTDNLVVLLPGNDARVLGVSTRTRNLRVAVRAGWSVIRPEALDGTGEPTILVPAGVMIDSSLFPLAPTSTPMWLESGENAAVLVGPARELRPYAAQVGAANLLPRQRVGPTTILDVSSRAARRRSAWSVLQRTGKLTDGWVSRRCNRPVSRIISFALLWMGFTPNHASMLTLLVGVAAGALAARPGYGPLVATAVLFHFASVLDGVDGEIARATLTESEMGARFDTIVDQLTYVASILGLTIGWFREGAGIHALYWTAALAAALVISLLRGWRFVTRYAPGTSFVFIDRAVQRAARESERPLLKSVAAGFTLLRRDAIAGMFLLTALTGRRWLALALVALGIVLANLTLAAYRRELIAAAAAERSSG